MAFFFSILIIEGKIRRRERKREREEREKKSDEGLIVSLWASSLGEWLAKLPRLPRRICIFCVMLIT